MTRHRLLLAATVGLLLLAAAGGVWLQQSLAPAVPGAAESQVVTIPRGAASTQVADELAERGIIRSAWAFRLWTRYRGVDSQLMAGEYRVSPSESVPDLVERFVRGDVLMYRVTIPEGFRLEQIVTRLSTLEFVDEARLQELAASRQWVDAWLPDDERILRPLEGYLFPDTYTLTRDMSEEELIDLMLRHTLAAFSAERLERAAELGMDVHQVLTLASIVERETRVAGEYTVIAGVFWNRLDIGMKLDADPTVHYALDEFTEPLTHADLEVDSPYNTYQHNGLPPGPIASPGRQSIEAVLYADEHDYLYFVLRDEASGEHVFARTLEEHNANVRRYR